MEDEKKVWTQRRGMVETVFSSIKRMFGEYMYRQPGIKIW